MPSRPSALARAAALVIASFLLGGATMPPRDLTSKLDDRRHREAEVVIGTVVRPGPVRGSHVVTFDGSDAEIVAASTTGSRTFAPGSRVSIARPDGSRDPVVIGGPPPGQQGGATFGVQRVPPPPPPMTSRPYYAYFFTGAEVESWLYQDGEPDRLLGVLDGSTDGAAMAFDGNLDIGPGQPVLADPTRRVSPASVAFGGVRVPFVALGTPYGPQMAVWDPAASKVYHLVVDGISENDVVRGPAVHGGRVYWIVSLHDDIHPELSFTVATLYGADADMTNVAVVGTVAVSPGTSGTVQSYQIISPGAVEVALGRSMVRAEFTGGGSSSDNEGVEHPNACEAGSGSLGVTRVPFTPSLDAVVWRPDALGATFVQRFPNSGVWSYRSIHKVTAGADGATGVAFVERTDPQDTALTIPTIIVFNAASPGAAPIRVFAVQPVDGLFPDFLVPGY